MPLSQTRLTKVTFLLKKTTLSPIVARPVLLGRRSQPRDCTLLDKHIFFICCCFDAASLMGSVIYKKQPGAATNQNGARHQLGTTLLFY